MTGDLVKARRLLDEAIDQLSAFDAFNAYPFVRAASATLAFVDGNSARAQIDIGASIARGGGTGMWDQLWLARAHAWAEVDAGRPEDRVAALVEGMRSGIETSHYGWSALALHDAIGWGAAATVVDSFRMLRAQMHAAPMMECLADSAISLADGDLDEARRHIGTLLELGSWWHAGVVSCGPRCHIGEGVVATARTSGPHSWRDHAQPTAHGRGARGTERPNGPGDRRHAFPLHPHRQ